MTTTNGSTTGSRRTARKPIKIYELYPLGLGRFSVQTADYCGDALMVAATSVRQAFAVAHKNVWINPEYTHPVGIVSKYDRRTGFRLWCGCKGHGVTGGDVAHGDWIRALRAAIASHHCDARGKVMNVPPLDASHAPEPQRAEGQHEEADHQPT